MPYEKVGKNEPVCIADEVPFEIPDSWEWVRLGHVCDIARGGSPRPIKAFLTEDPNGINWIKIGDTDKGGKYINSTKERIIPEGVSKSRMVYAGDFLLTNSMSFGRPYILNVDGCIHDGWLVLSRYNCAYDQDFLFHMLSSRFAYFQFCDVVSGAVVKNLNSDKVTAALFPLPPLSEQKRIVEAIERVIPSVNEYDAAESLLSNLNSTFPDRLKKSILQEAVQGKLVPQDLNDEPASVLLERIRAEKQKLIAEGKIKKDKHESVIFRRDNSHYEIIDGEERCIDAEIPFEIPDTWEWIRLNELCKKIGAGSTPSGGKAVYVSEGIKFIRSQNVYNDGLRLSDIAHITEDTNLKKVGSIVQAKDILLNITGGSIGRCAIVPDDFDIANINQHVMIIRLVAPIMRQWIHSILISDYIQTLIMDVQVGVSREGLSAKKLMNFLIPIPPVLEQRRIVEKQKELFDMINLL